MLESLFIKLYGEKPDSIVPITNSGSNRRYFRLSKEDKTVIGVIGTSVEENRAFLYLSDHFGSLGLPVPKILAKSADDVCDLQEDLGSVSLFDLRSDLNLLKETIRTLADIQYKGAENLDFSRCYPVAAFDSRAVLWDLNYFKYCFLNTTGVTYNEGLLEEEFRKMSHRLGDDNGKCFMYRDFQSRNVMIKDSHPYFIDYQGGRRGPAIYDLVSFVNQARAGFSPATRDALIKTYIESASRYEEINVEAFLRSFQDYSLLRNLQVLGAYGFRGRFERKLHFIASIARALESLSTLIGQNDGEYPYLYATLSGMIDKEKAGSHADVVPESSNLTVKVSSFSYKKGIPEDPSGNGGGFVFDCRGMDNPGRYDEFKALTGLDKPVIEFLESRGEIQPFLINCMMLVAPSVECYIRRGFSSLSISFGCTGGQHRSVYSAQQLALQLKKQYPQIRVHLIHREQKIDEVL